MRRDPFGKRAVGERAEFSLVTNTYCTGMYETAVALQRQARETAALGPLAVHTSSYVLGTINNMMMMITAHLYDEYAPTDPFFPPKNKGDGALSLGHRKQRRTHRIEMDNRYTRKRCSPLGFLCLSMHLATLGALSAHHIITSLLSNVCICPTQQMSCGRMYVRSSRRKKWILVQQT